MGVRLQRLREERGISQVALAKSLGISPSYLNQIEHNQRPMTVPLLLRINAQLGVDVQLFSEDEATKLIADVRDALADTGVDASFAEIRALASNMPVIARAVIDLHQRNRVATERADTLAALLGDEHRLTLPSAHDDVRDYFNKRANHVAELDSAAEATFYDAQLTIGGAASQLARRLADRHNVRIVIEPTDDTDIGKGRFDAGGRTLRLPDYLRPGQQAFQMAAQLALLEQEDTLGQLIIDGGFLSEASQRLARVGLANYFAGALVMPYGSFLQCAEELSYDVERLSNRFDVGFEAICHRLSTLQRPGACGLPFFFVRVDRAGNVSKRHSAAEFHFSRVGGTCPLWVVYEAFSQPGRVLSQIAGMPDGRSYFWIARQVLSGPPGFGRPRQTFAIGLGCDVRHAHRVIYSRGLNLAADAATPIGAGCKVCERGHCPQRAFPPLV